MNKTDLEKYMADQARFWEDRQNDEAFVRAGKFAQEHEARKRFGKFYKEFFAPARYSGDQIAEICSTSPVFTNLGLTPNEVRSIVASDLETRQRKLAEAREFSQRLNEDGGGDVV